MHRMNGMARVRPATLLFAGVVLAAAALGGCGDSGGSAQSHLEKARTYLSQGKGNSAVIELKNTLQLDPDNGEARFLLGELYAGSGDPKAAEKELRRALELNIPKETVAPPLARALLREGKYKEVLDETGPFLDDAGKSTPVLYVMRGHALRALDREKEGCASFGKARDLQKDYVPARVGEAMCSASAGDLNDARRRLKDIITDHPDTLDAYLLLARVERAAGNDDAALQRYGEAIDLNANAIAAYVGKAELLLKEGRVADAEKAVDSALKRAPDNVPAKHVKGVVLFRQGKYRDAAVQFQDVLRTVQYPPSQLWLGFTDYAQGNMEQANQRLRAYVNGHPDAPVAKYMYALTQARLGGDSDAVATLRELSDKDLGSPQMLAAVARAQLVVGDAKSGVDRLKRAVERNPKDPGLRLVLANLLMHDNDHDAADEQLRIAGELGGDQGGAAEFLLVRNLLAQGKLDEAAKVADRLAQRQPDRPEPQVLRGAVLMEQGNAAGAGEAFDKALKIDPGNIAALHGKAMLALRAKDYPTAKALYGKILDSRPQDKRALLAMYALAGREGDAESATKWLKKATEADPQDTNLLARYVRTLLQNGNGETALAAVNQALAEKPDDTALMQAKGMTLMALNRKDDAAQVFQKLTEREPQSVTAWLNLGNVQQSLGNTEDARKALGKALDLSPRDPRVLESLTKLELGAGNADKAVEHAKALIAAAPKDMEGYLAKAEALARKGELDEARSTLDAAQKAVGDNEKLALARARLLYGAGHRDEAVRQLADWVKDKPGAVAARHELAGYYQAMGDDRRAAELYEALLKERPRDVVAMNNLAFIYTAEQPKRALELARRASELAPNDPRIADTLGWALLANDQVDEARSVLAKASDQLSGQPSVRYHYAVALSRTGEREKAIEELDSLLSSAPRFAERGKAEELVKRLKDK